MRHGVGVAVTALVTYWALTGLLARIYSISRSDDQLGAMWAVISALFVYRFTSGESVAAALSRMAATGVSFALCLAYLLLFPFSPLGMAVLIGIGAAAMLLLRRPGDVVTTGITTAVVLVVAALTPYQAWRDPILRLVDTAVGVAIGLPIAWLNLNGWTWLRGHRVHWPLGAPSSGRRE